MKAMIIAGCLTSKCGIISCGIRLDTCQSSTRYWLKNCFNFIISVWRDFILLVTFTGTSPNLYGVCREIDSCEIATESNTTASRPWPYFDRHCVKWKCSVSSPIEDLIPDYVIFVTFFCLRPLTITLHNFWIRSTPCNTVRNSTGIMAPKFQTTW